MQNKPYIRAELANIEDLEKDVKARKAYIDFPATPKQQDNAMRELGFNSVINAESLHKRG